MIFLYKGFVCIVFWFVDWDCLCFEWIGNMGWSPRINYINPCSLIPASSLSVSWGSFCLSGSCVAMSLELIELIIFLKSSNLSTGILNPFFVGPV